MVTSAQRGPLEGHTSWVQWLRVAQPATTLVALLCFAIVGYTSRTRRRRTRFTAFSILSLLATYFIAGALLVLRAVVPADKVWTPRLPLWHEVDYQILFQIIALGSTLVLIAWQQRQNGIGICSVAPLYSAAILGGVTDVALLVLYGLAAQSRKDFKSPWTWGQLSMQILRIVVLWPLLVVLAYASEATGDSEDGSAATDAPVQAQGRSDETTPLLAAQGPSSQAANGAASSSGSVTPAKNGHATGATNGHANGAAHPHGNSSAASANASMGLSVANQPPPPTFKVFFKRIVLLFPYLWPSKSTPLQGLALLCVFLLLVGRIVNLAVPLLLGRIVDRLAGNNDGNRAGDALSVWWLIGAYALLKCLQGSGGLLVVMQNFAWLPLQQYSDRQMSLMAFRHLLDLSMSFHTKRKTGEVLRILDRGSSINNFFQYLIFSVAPIFFDIFIATGFLSVTFGPQVGLLLFAIMFIYTAISVKMTTWRTGLRRDANNKDSVSRAIHTDVLLNWETVKSYNNEGYESERYRLSLLDYQRAEWKVNASLNVLNLVQNLTLSVGTLLMLFVVAYDVVNGYANSSDFVVFISYLSQIYQPLNMLSTLYRVIQTSLVDTDKLIALLGEEKDVKDVPDAKGLEVRDGVIEFRNVKFSYDGKVEALKGLNFTIKPKSKVALVGESGAGKSSVLRLLYRFYDPSSGQILIDGQDIRKVTQHSLRKAIGVVPQEAGLLNTSIKTNIGYGRTEPPASDEEIDAAAAAAQILEKIQSFPEGMDTVVGERGVRLSGGEKQRVAIARTFLKAPPILLLDEATSALDSQTERQLQSALTTLMEGKTSLTIAHRLSTIVNSDQIIVLGDGAVLESGTHEELLELPNGRYRAMWKSQVETDKERERTRAEEKKRADEELEQEPQDQAAAAATTTTTAATPAQGMLGIVSPVTSPLDTQAVQEQQRESDVASAATAATTSRETKEDDKVAPAATTAQQTVEAEMLAPVSEASREDDSSSNLPVSSDNEPESTAAAASTAAPTAPAAPAAPAPPSPVTRQVSLSRQSTRSVSGTATTAVYDREGAPSIQGSTSGSIGGGSSHTDKTAGGGGRMRQRFASLMRRSTSTSSGGGGGGGGAGDEDAPAASPTPTSPLLRRTLSLKSNHGSGGGGGGGGSPSPRSTNVALPNVSGGDGGGAREAEEGDQPQRPQQAQPPPPTKPISTSGVSAGAGKKNKKNKRGKRK